MRGLRSSTSCSQLKHQQAAKIELTAVLTWLPNVRISRQSTVWAQREGKGNEFQLWCPHNTSQESAGINHFMTNSGGDAPTATAKATFPSTTPLLCVCGRKRLRDLLSFRPSILWNNPYSYLSWLGILLSLCNSLHPILLLHFQCFWGAGRAAEGRENGCYSQRHEAQQHHNETNCKQVPKNYNILTRFYCAGLLILEPSTRRNFKYTHCSSLQR